MHRYILYLAFVIKVCLYVFFLFGFYSLGLRIHTWAGVQLHGIDMHQDVVENAHMVRGGAYRVQHFWYEHGMHRKYRHVGILE